MGRFQTPAEAEAYYSRERRNKESRRKIPNQPAATITNHYPYKPLNSFTHEIRLLKLGNPPKIGARTNYSPFHISLDCNDTVPVQERCRYDALSYTWSDHTGNADLTAAILIDGHEVQVTKNLAAALREIFRPDADFQSEVDIRAGAHSDYGSVTLPFQRGSRPGHDRRRKKSIWVDAICINQSDVNERNHQVSKMGLVYAKAEKVITWLGEEYRNSAEAFAFFRSLLKHGVKKTISKTWVPWHRLKHIENQVRAVTTGGRKWVSWHRLKHVENQVWAVIWLFARDYWRRVWVLQELRFAKDVIFCAGSETIELRELRRVQAMLWNGSKILTDMLQSTEVGHLIARLWQDGPNIVQIGHSLSQEGPNVIEIGNESEMSNSKRLGEMLVKHRRKDASDPRDKVFAILALCDGPAKRGVRVDYDLDTSNVLLEATRYVLEQEQDLLILCENKDRETIARMGENSSENSSMHSAKASNSHKAIGPVLECAQDMLELPSWVPNFALPPTRQKARISEWCQYFSLPRGEALVNDSIPPETDREIRGMYVSAAGSTKPQISISQDGKILSTEAIRIGTITEVSRKTMPAFEAAEFDFYAVYEVLRDWFLTFTNYGGAKLEGPGGLLDLILFGGLYKIDIGADERNAWIKETLIDLKILVQTISGAEVEEKVLHLLDSVEVKEQLSNARKHAARVNMFGVSRRCKERSFVVLNTPETRFAIGPECAMVGDLVVVFSGCAIPLVLRKINDQIGAGWYIIGDIYVNGVIDGRVVEEVGRLMEKFDIF